MHREIPKQKKLVVLSSTLAIPEYAFKSLSNANCEQVCDAQLLHHHFPLAVSIIDSINLTISFIHHGETRNQICISVKFEQVSPHPIDMLLHCSY